MTRSLRYATVAFIATMILAFWLAGGEARGQATGTATGTPTSTATPAVSPTVTPTVSTTPSGQDLLTEMATAVALKNTVHVTSRVTAVAARTMREVETLQGDVSVKPMLERVVGTTRTTRLDRQPATTTARRVEVIVVRQKAAIKDGKNPWSCTSVGQTTQGVSSLIGSSQVQSVENLGAEALGTAPVWHVRATVMVALGGTPVPISADYYIAQADFTLLRETASASITVSGVTLKEKIVQDYSKYGEKVSVKLPSACRGKGAAADAPATQMLRAFGSPARPAVTLAAAVRAVGGEIRRAG